jgi:hypothetical protein
MRRQTCLYRLNRSLQKRINRLEAIAGPVVGKDGSDIDRAVSFTLVELMTSWSNFVREFYLSCATLAPKTISGSRVTHSKTGLNNERDALIFAIAVLKAKTITKPRIAPLDEPTWREKRALATLSQNLGLSNNTAIVNALSYSTTFFDHAHTVRNFYAHRSEGTVVRVLDLALRDYGLRISHPHALMNKIHPGRTDTILQEWLSDVRVIANTMCA